MDSTDFEEIVELENSKKQILRECLKWFWGILCGGYLIEFWTRNNK